MTAAAGRRAFLRLGAATGLALALGGCGFRLRGSRAGAAVLPDVFLEGESYGDLLAELSQQLRNAGTRVVARRAEARVVVVILDERRDKRVLSVGSTGKVQEYELHYAVRFVMTDGAGAVLLAEQALSLVRDFSFSDTDVMAKGLEEDALYRDLRRDAVREMVRRLRVPAGGGG